MDKHRIELEEKYKTQHLPDNVREMVFHVAYERGHAYGLAEVDIEYDDLADLAKAAYSAGCDAARTVCELEAAPVVDVRKDERARVVMYVMGWLDMSPSTVAALVADMEDGIPL